MKRILLAVSMLLCMGCSPQKKLLKKHPECQDYINYISDNWQRKDNGFYTIKEVKDSTLNEWQQLEAPPFFITQWKSYFNGCIQKFSEKEVVVLFGKPTKIVDAPIRDNKERVKRLIYYISDGECEETIPKDNAADKCGGVSFTFIGDDRTKSRQNIFYRGHGFTPLGEQ